MLRHKLSLSFPIFCQMLFMVFISTATAAGSNIYVECSEVDFTRLTPYHSNVNSLFTSLVDSASVTNFNKFEISETSVVYGLYQCRGDLKSSECKDCVASSVNQLKTTCPLSVGGRIQLDECFLKYENTPFFGVQNTVEVLNRCGPLIAHNSDILNGRDDALVNLIAGNGKYFHGGDYGSIRGEAQCVQDLSLSDCQDCLSEASGRLRSQCETSSWGDMFLGKCYIRYHDRDIGQSSNNNSKDNGRGNNSKLIAIIASVILAMTAGVTFIIKVSGNNCCNTNHVSFPKSAVHRKSVKHETEEQLAAELATSVSASIVKDKAAREKPEAQNVIAKATREEPASVKAKPATEKPEEAKASSKKPEAASVKPEATTKRSKPIRTHAPRQQMKASEMQQLRLNQATTSTFRNHF